MATSTRDEIFRELDRHYKDHVGDLPRILGTYRFSEDELQHILKMVQNLPVKIPVRKKEALNGNSD